MTDIIIKALEATGQRGIVSKGWGGLGNCMFWILSLLIEDCIIAQLIYTNSGVSFPCVKLCMDVYWLFDALWPFCPAVAEPKEYVYLLDNCPHDWLFARCSAVVKLKFLSCEVNLLSKSFCLIAEQQTMIIEFIKVNSIYVSRLRKENSSVLLKQLLYVNYYLIYGHPSWGGQSEGALKLFSGHCLSKSNLRSYLHLLTYSVTPKAEPSEFFWWINHWTED